MTDKTIQYYSQNSRALLQQYDSLAFESVHADWLQRLPGEGTALDIGAGSGRDARFLATHGLSVVAVEPAENLLHEAQVNSAEHGIHWLNDTLPELRQVFALQMKFDIILLSAVWMHILPSQRERSFRKLSSLLKPNGKLVISLRHGACHDERKMYPVSADELKKLATQFGLTYTLLSSEQQNDQLGRDDVYWQTVLLTLPDDGTGAFPLIRNIVVNDRKASTYKVALLRTLLRIAEGHPGAVMEQTDGHVALPMGLVALYWLKLYKPLLDQHGMQQLNGSGSKPGFVKASGWEKLRSYVASDFYLGARYRNTEVAAALHNTLRHIAALIKQMPAHYTTLPGSSDPVFTVELSKSRISSAELCLDYNFLASLGTFYVPLRLWESFTRFSLWIEPAIINEWVGLMMGYQPKLETKFTKLDFMVALQWEDPVRATAAVRQRVQELLSTEKLPCSWSGNSLKKDYVVDHAFPFARWPNNDLWNLLPANGKVNSEKSDKLPSRQRLIESRERITWWWQNAWGQGSDEFFTQANFALPNLGAYNRNFDDVFEAFTLQRDRIKDFQQLQDW
ncbi:MAG: class I SAM-dependent methyltransferase [Idiomarina sp.]